MRPSRNRPVVADILLLHCNHIFEKRFVPISVLHKVFLSCPNHQMKELQMSFRPNIWSRCHDCTDAELIDRFSCAEEQSDVSVIAAESSRFLTVFSNI